MTIKEVSNQLFKLSKGKVDGQKFKKKDLESYLSLKMGRRDAHLGRINLPDGEWLFLLDRFPNDKSQYGYYIPDTRERETILLHNFLKA